MGAKTAKTDAHTCPCCGHKSKKIHPIDDIGKGTICPFCGDTRKTRIYHKPKVGGNQHAVRCKGCGRKYWTFERVVGSPRAFKTI